MLATAGRAKKEIAKTEKQEATILPGTNIDGNNFHHGINTHLQTRYWPRIKLWSCHMNLILPAQVRGTVSPYPIVVTVIWKIFLNFLWRIFCHFMTVWVLCSHPILNYRHCHWQKRQRRKKSCTLAKRLALFRLSVCATRWWEIDIWWTGPEMSLTAFYNLLLVQNYLSSDWHHWMIQTRIYSTENT